MKRWEIIADDLSKAGWSWGYVSALDTLARTIWITDANRDDGRRFIVRADEKLIADSGQHRTASGVGQHLISLKSNKASRLMCAW